MSKKRKKKKLSRRVRRHQGQAGGRVRPANDSAPQAGTDESAAAQPPTPETPEARPAITATFTPSEAGTAAPAPAAAEEPAAPAAQSPAPPAGTPEAEYVSVRKDLRKLGLTVVAFVVIITALAVINAQTGFVGSLGSGLFHLWR